MELNGFAQMVTDPTRVASISLADGSVRTSTTLIDHVYTTKAENISKCEVLSNSLSDHFPQLVIRKLNHSKTEHKFVVAYRSSSSSALPSVTTDITSLDLSVISTLQDCNIATDFLQHQIQDILNKHMPIKVRKINSKANIYHIDVPLRKLRDETKALMKRFPGSSFYSDYYKQLRNQCLSQYRSKVRQKVANTLSKAESARNQSAKYHCLKMLTNKQNLSTISELYVDGKVLSVPKDIANSLNHSFASVCLIILTFSTTMSLIMTPFPTTQTQKFHQTQIFVFLIQTMVKLRVI